MACGRDNLESLSPGYGQIRYLPISDTDITIEFALLYLQSHTLTKIELEFIEEVKKVIDG